MRPIDRCGHVRDREGDVLGVCLRRITIIVLLACAATVLAGLASAATSGGFTQKGIVTRVVDGDTVDVRLDGGKSERVRLIGIDAAERGTCFSSQATERARQLALSKPVVLRGDRTQDTRDRYGRLLAYVWLPGGRDLGYQLVAGGFAKVYVYSSPFQRLPAYQQPRAAQGRVPRDGGRHAARSGRSCRPRRRPGSVTPAIRRACRSSATSIVQTSAPLEPTPCACSAPTRTGSTATAMATAATSCE